MNKFATATAAVVATCLAGAAGAVTIIPVSAVGSSSFAGYADSSAIDTGPGAALSDWASFGEGTASYLDLDLGAVYTLTGVAATDRVTSGGGNNAFSGGLFDFTTQYSITAYTDASFTTVIGSPFVFSKSAPNNVSGIADFLDVESLTGLTAQFLRYNVLAANGDNPGLSDIRFEGTIANSTAPEPRVWALLVIGFGLIGVTSRRRRPVIAA